MTAEIRIEEVQKVKNVKLYELLLKENGYTVLDLDNIDLMGALRIAQEHNCKTITIFEE